MKKLLLLLTIPLLMMAGCNKDMGTGTLDFNYVFVKSKITGDNYYHICRWKEYDPEPSSALSDFYVGLEISTVSGQVFYWYEQNLQYLFTKNYVPSLGTAIE